MSMKHILDRYLHAGERLGLIDSTAAVIIAAVALAVFIGLASLVPSARLAGNETRSISTADMRRCEIRADPSARLACYDAIAERAALHPAKGANAPAEAFVGMRRTRFLGD
jgi:hypothetical protein